MTDEITTRTRRRVRGSTSSTSDDTPERARRRAHAADEAPDVSGSPSDGSTSVRRRRVRRRDVTTVDDGGTTTRTVSADEATPASDEDTTGDGTDSNGSGGGSRRSGSRRGGRGRGGRGRSSGKGRGDDAGADATAPQPDTPPTVEADDGDAKAGKDDGAKDTRDTTDAKNGKNGKGNGKSRGGDARSRDDEEQSGRGRNRRGRRKQGGSAPRGGVSEEVRRAITEGPPRRMLVSVGSQRTEVAVLEERDLVEHYVTRKENESYVGNIYVGRVQNVLPGMEAAFVDIGKGRNGVLYAGEVNYDDEDVESKAPRIEQALKPGQTVVVQVTKDPMGTKGARLTQQLSLAGRFCVLAIEDGTVGISRKLTDAERDRLRETLKRIKPDGYGLIVRTAAAAATAEQLEADVNRLLHRWEQVQERLKGAAPLSEVYREPELAMRVIRDIYGPEYTELICDDDQLAEQIEEYLTDVSPDLARTLRRYTGDQPLFDAYEITNQVRRALEKKVWLASGGYLIIEKTEAMWVIDVNTGKFVGDSNLEETVLRNNLEAAEEIARQLRLRDMGGIIVIDFVDMLLPANRDEVLKRFKRELARDKTKSRVMEISKLGLVQMTRKNVSQGLTETFTRTCECCEGRGAQIVDKALKR